MCEMWKRQQVNEDTREMHRAEILMDLVQKMLGQCEAENGAKIDELL